MRGLWMVRRMGESALVGRLAALDSCAVSDAMDAVGLDGVVPRLGPMWPCPRVAGRVVTVRLEQGSGRHHPGSRHLGTTAVEMSENGDVIVVDNGGRTGVAGWGGLLSRAARQRGIAAVIVYGACRDVDEGRELGLPLYASAATPRTARGRVVEAATAEPIQLGGVFVEQGDLVIADHSGVVFVPAGRAAEIITGAEQIVRREHAMAGRIDAGDRPSDVMGATYEGMLERIGTGGQP